MRFNKQITIIWYLATTLSFHPAFGDQTHSKPDSETEILQQVRDDHDSKENNDHESNPDHDDTHENEEDDKHEHEESSGVGKNKAITETGHGNRFRLSKEAVVALKLESQTLKKQGSMASTFRISQASLVSHQDEYSVFIDEGEGWYRSISVSVVEFSNSLVVVQSNFLQADLKIVTKGAGLLRVAALEVSGKGGKGHAH
ncbi:MAG: hypothetical protein CL678_14250 [Bdellovibrionaceae bacterium]|nr:hypothetical protein [Pseudobdellovibrionaceae bacterium]|tara:strand:+ start:1984 stop:2583 length:600 start_codon:yes stop_codon:yes gene_type:complete